MAQALAVLGKKMMDDQMIDDQNTQPPTTIILAIRMIWACLIITVLGWVLLFFGLMSVPKDVTLSAMRLGLSAHAFAIFNIAALTVRAAIIYFLMSKLRKGRNWARIVCLIAASIEILHDTYHSFSHIGCEDNKTIIISFINTALNCALYGYAMYLLFKSPGKDWFQKNQSALSA